MIFVKRAFKLAISVLAIAVLGNSIVSSSPVSENERVPYEEKGIGSHAQKIQDCIIALCKSLRHCSFPRFGCDHVPDLRFRARFRPDECS